MAQMLTNIREYGGLALYNATVGTFHEVRKVGFIKGTYKIFSAVDGIEKFTKVALADYDAFKWIDPQTAVIFAPMMKVVSDYKDVIYATGVVSAISKFIKKDKKGRLHFQLPPLVEVLYSIGAVCETGKFIQKQGICSFEQCTLLANKMGAFKIFDVQPFTYRPFQFLTDRPKEFFIFTGCVIELGSSVKRFFLPSEKLNREFAGFLPVEERKKINREAELSVMNLLKQIGNAGKIYLIWNSAQFNRIGFIFVNCVTQNASLFAYLIKTNIR